MEDELYALTPVSSSNKDLCGNGQISLAKYKDDNTWTSDSDIKLNFDDIIDASFYQYQTVLTSSTAIILFTYMVVYAVNLNTSQIGYCH